MMTLVDERETAKLLAVSVKTLRRWRWAGRELPYHKIGNAVRYSLDDLAAYIERHKQCKDCGQPVANSVDLR